MATVGDDEIITDFSPESGRTVYGPCPGCDWQLDAPYLESRAAVEAILREHDVQAHPGLLAHLVEARSTELRSSACPLRCGYSDPIAACVRLHLIQHHDYGYFEAQEAYPDE